MRLRFLYFFLFTSSLAHAGGGWPQARRTGYFKMSQNSIVASNIYAGNGMITPLTPSVGIYTTSLYGEYGLTDRLTVMVYAPVFVRVVKNELRFRQSGKVESGDYLNSFGDLDISLKFGLLSNKPIVLSLSLLLGLPLGNSAGGKEGVLQTGDGEFNQMLRVDASHSFYPQPFYVSAYAGVNNRTNNFSDEMRIGAEVGYTLRTKCTVIAKLDVVQSFFNGSESVPNNGIFSNNTEYIAPQLELAYAIKENWGLSLSVGVALGARNILAAPNMGAGIYFKTKANSKKE